MSLIISSCPAVRVPCVPSKGAGSSCLCVCVCWCSRGLGTHAAGVSAAGLLQECGEDTLVFPSCFAALTRERLPGLVLLQGLPGIWRHTGCLVFPAGNQRVPQLSEHCLCASCAASFAHSGSASLHTSSPRCPSLPLTVPCAQLGAVQPVVCRLLCHPCHPPRAGATWLNRGTPGTCQ